MFSPFKESLIKFARLSSLLQTWRWSQPFRPIYLLFGVGLSLTLVMAACTDASQNAATPVSPTAESANLVLRIGHQKFDPLTLVKAKGNLEARLKPLGVSAIEWTEFQAGPPMLEALNVGSIDVARTGDAPPIIAQAANAPLVYVGGSAPKDRSSAVLVKQNSSIRSIADLKGRKVAIAKGSSANYLIVRVLESGGLKWQDIEPVYLSPADARSAFEQGSVDAWAIWDPFYAVAQAKADARVLRDSQGLVGNRDFFLSTGSFADRHPNVIEAIATEVQAVAAWADANPQQVAAVLSPILGIEQPILETVTKRRNYGFESIAPEMIAEQQAIADSFFQLKLIPKSIKVADIVWKSK